MKKKLYTRKDLEEIYKVYTNFYTDDDGALVVVRKVNTPSYVDGLRRDKVENPVFVLRGAKVRLVGLKAIFDKVLDYDYEPVEVMMRIHNYGVYGHKHITVKNIEHLLQVVDAILTPEHKRTYEQKVLALLARDLE